MLIRNKKIKACTASYATLAQWLGTTPASVFNTISNLQRKGFLKTGWLHENFTKNSHYNATKYKTPTHITKLAEEADDLQLYIPEYITCSQALNLTDKIIYGVINLIVKVFRKKTSIKAEGIKDTLTGISLPTIYNSLSKMRALGILEGNNLPKKGYSPKVEESLAQVRARQARGLSKPGYVPKPKKVKEQLYFSFSFKTSSAPVEKKIQLKNYYTDYNTLMDAFIEGIPNIIFAYGKRGNAFDQLIPQLKEKDARLTTKNNIKMSLPWGMLGHWSRS